MCVQLLALCFCVSAYVFPCVGRFCHSPQEPFFARGQGLSVDVRNLLNDSRSVLEALIPSLWPLSV